MDAYCGALELLGAGTVFTPKERNLHEFCRQIERGLPGESVEILIRNVPLSGRSEWRRYIAGRHVGPHLNVHYSERAGRLAYILALSKEVWGEWTAAHTFLTKPHPLLDGRSPLSTSKTEWGAREVETLLRKIQFGLPV